ncbi:hypothetical protein Lesp02_03730 [Lentzea sp. NBRC 105346]|uniref:DUF3558 family protein n=1 Tax=Lentzea sp. NBRC 105346 TaxID=3032205 RepID=UPI0024A062A5|nr:DUF3558 family protein [Lentzea sp. NBRC 105346]GLZ28183.1 hypothetical protein Lesp02_03730 [Lentzea sp. NBRC 105346]
MPVNVVIRACVTAAAAGAILAGCTTTVTGTPTAQPASSDASAPQNTAPDSPGQQNDQAAVKLGDLNIPADAKSVGAPFDPCQVGWPAFPEAVRPRQEKKPKLRDSGGDIPFDTACRYDNSDDVKGTVDPKTGQATVKSGKDLIALIIWSKPGGIPGNPAEVKGAVAATFAGKAGWTKTGATSKGSPICTTAVQLANGVGGVSVTNSRFPQTDTCEIAKAVTDKIAAATP